MSDLIDATELVGGCRERQDSLWPWGLGDPGTTALARLQLQPTGLAIAVLTSSPLLCCSDWFVINPLLNMFKQRGKTRLCLLIEIRLGPVGGSRE